MRRNQPPRLWIVTDARADAALDEALARLPRGSGVLFRHHHLPPAARRARFEAVRHIARRRRLVLVLAGPARQAAAWRADGCHGRDARATARPLIRTAAAHDRRELIAGMRRGAHLLLLSPVFATRSHPGGRMLGPARFGLAARGIKVPVLALGGMSAARFPRLRALGASGWAAIDALSRPDQKR